jgi:hypothetical protein
MVSHDLAMELDTSWIPERPLWIASRMAQSDGRQSLLPQIWNSIIT